MEWFSKLIEWLKLPVRIIAFIAVMSCAFLFLPPKIIGTLKLQDFIDLYGKYFGVSFIIATSYLFFTFICFISGKIKSFWLNRKNLINQMKELKIQDFQIQEAIKSLTNSERCLMREFFLQRKDVIKVISQNEDVVSLYNKGFICYASQYGERYIFGTVINIKMTDVAKKHLTFLSLGLPENPNDNDLNRCAKERPAFIWQILEMEGLKNNMLNTFHNFF